MQVVVNTLLTQYDRQGNGEAVALFLHGWADNHQTFKPLIAGFLERNPMYTAISLDLPGFGGTQQPSKAWGLPDYAQFVAEFLKKINVVKPALIVGHSNGGAIAMYGTAHGLFSSDSLALIGSAGIRNKSTKKSLLRAAAKPTKLALAVLPNRTQQQVKKKMYGAIGSDYMVAGHLQDTFKQVVSYDVRKDADSIAVPVCLIYGQDDEATPPAYGNEFASLISGSELTVIPTAGHFVHQEKADIVTATISDFLTRNEK